MIAVSVKKKGKRYSVDRHASWPLAPGIVVDGEVNDVEALSAAIREFWDAEKFRDRTVNVGIANQRTISRVIELPRIRKKNQLRDALSFEVADHLPIPLEDAVWDYHSIGSFTDDESGAAKERHLVVAAYRESVIRFREAVEGAGLKLRRIDLSAFALMRAGLAGAVESHLDPDQQQVIAFCDFGFAATNLAISRDGVCELNRMVAFGSSSFAETLAEQFGWTLADADRVSLESGVTPMGGMETAGDPYTDSRQVMQYVVDLFASELRTSFDYYQHSGGAPVTKIVISGMGARFRGIELRLSAVLGLPVMLLDASGRLDDASAEAMGQHSHLAVALGLAMEDAA